MDRFNQMSGQADLIAKKKIEIEAKLKLQKEAAQNSGSISVYNQLAGTSKNIPAAESSSSNQRRKKALPIGNLKNRWGFKGKADSETKRPSTATSGKETKNTFTNDGSFFEQFKKMQQKPQNQEGSKIYDSKSDNDNIMNSKQSTLSLGYAANTNSSAHKRMLTSPPPPPPKPSDSKDNPSQDTPDKPKEADEWYKQALERARSIAKKHWTILHHI